MNTVKTNWNQPLLSLFGRVQTSPAELADQNGEPQARKVGSLQDQLLAASGPQQSVNKQIASDFGVGLPPRFSGDATPVVQTKVVRGRVIHWSSVGKSCNVAA